MDLSALAKKREQMQKKGGSLVDLERREQEKREQAMKARESSVKLEEMMIRNIAAVDGDVWQKQLETSCLLPATVTETLTKDEVEFLSAAASDLSDVRAAKNNVAAILAVCEQKADTHGRAVFDGLVAKVSRLQTSVGCVGSGAFFLKLSSRSAKDSVLGTAKMMDEIRRNPAPDMNAAMKRFIASNVHCLVFSDATHAVFSLMTSARVAQDTDRALRAHTDVSLIAKEVVPFEVDMEFRCWTAGNRLTAISQYYWNIYSERLQSESVRDDIAGLLADTYATAVVPCLKNVVWKDSKSTDYSFDLDAERHIPYSIDFGITNYGTPDARVYVIELNPFHEVSQEVQEQYDRGEGQRGLGVQGTHPALYNYTNDYEILAGMSGRDKPDFRVQTVDPTLSSIADLKAFGYTDEILALLMEGDGKLA